VVVRGGGTAGGRLRLLRRPPADAGGQTRPRRAELRRSGRALLHPRLRLAGRPPPTGLLAHLGHRCPRRRSPGECPALEAHTISWLPATLDIRPLRLSVEPGVNLDLHETIAYALSNGERVSVWGPYECRPSFYRRFRAQKDFIESGRVGYQCEDNFGEAARTGDGCDCIHAVSDLDPSTAATTTRSSGSATPPVSTSSTGCTSAARCFSRRSSTTGCWGRWG
jgi:hypothetical protein